MRGDVLLAKIASECWAIHPAKLTAIVAVLKGHQAEQTEQEWHAQRAAQRAARAASGSKSVAVLPIAGTIIPRSLGMGPISGLTSVEDIRAMYDAALADDTIGAIVADVDSPGGSVFGIQELATHIRETRKVKPTFAIANYEAHSGALWLASSFGKFYAQPSAQVGSHGVIMTYKDDSASNEKEGVKYEFVYAGENKAEGRGEPMTDEFRAKMQTMVNEYFERFTAGLAASRGVSKKHVLEKFGQGDSFISADAESRGMIDGVATFEQVLSMAGDKVARQQKAQDRRARLSALRG